MKSLLASTALFFVATAPSIAQNLQNNPTSNHGNKFEQLGTILPDANTYRTASGAPGHEYWQQRADYQIQATLDEKKQYLHGEETITYFNNSPDILTYIWLQIDELDKEILYQTSLPAGLGSNDIGLDRGIMGTTYIVKFSRIANKVC